MDLQNAKIKNTLQITFLGTGTSTGVPVITCDCEVCCSTNPKDKRLRPSLFVSTPTQNLIVDTGPDFRQQMLGINAKQLDAILMTHAHNDHITGLDDVRPFNFLTKSDMHVYATLPTQERLKTIYHYAFEQKYPGVPVIHLHTIQNQPTPLDIPRFDFPITPIQVYHGQMPVLGFIFHNAKNERFAYITDANRIPPEEMEKIKGCEYLVLNAVHDLEIHYSHFTLREAIVIAQQLAAKQTYITHISHKMGLHDEVQQALPPNIQLAYDGLSITF
ncbi:MAG: MBL fold metallo-hydrolase [Chitinophagales bacterium]